MSENTGGPAFPSAESFDRFEQAHIPADQGMTLRDYFAAKALSTLVETWADSSPKHADECAKIAYRFADAMLAERNKGE